MVKLGYRKREEMISMKSLGTKLLKTERLILKRISVADTDQVFENWASDPLVTRYLSWNKHESVEVTKRIVSLWENEYTNPDFYQWGIQIQNTGELVGTVGVVSLDHEHERASLGYCIGSRYWNQGYVTEAVCAVIQYLRTEVGVKRIDAKHHIDNPASGRVMEKCGMKYVGNSTAKNNKNEEVLCKVYEIE